MENIACLISTFALGLLKGRQHGTERLCPENLPDDNWQQSDPVAGRGRANSFWVHHSGGSTGVRSPLQVVQEEGGLVFLSTLISVLGRNFSLPVWVCVVCVCV